MKKILLSLTLMTAVASASMLGAPSTAHAGTCGEVESVASTLWAKYLALPTKMPYTKKVSAMVKFWKTQSFTARRLAYGVDLGGKVVGSEDEVLVVAAPSDKHFNKLTLEKLGGKGETSITVCQVDKAGNENVLWDIKAAKGDYTQTWTKMVANVKGKIITVHFQGHSQSSVFKYSFRASK
jgi:hypothetical protein